MKLCLHQRLSKLILRSVLPATIVLTALMCCCSASADDAAESAPRLTVKRDTDSSAADTTETAAVADDQPLPSLSESGFWFLNTKNSPQSFKRSCPKFCPAVTRYEKCVGFRPSSADEMWSGLEPGVPVCIVVHGSFVDTPSACYESPQIWNWIRSASMGDRMQMIYFHWPSFRRITPAVQLDANSLGLQAARNGYYLADLISRLPADCPVCLIGHSHGGRVVASALHLMAGGSVQGFCHPHARCCGRSIRVVLSAAAVDHGWFNPGRRYDRALCCTECVLNMKNRMDPVLKVYPLRLPLISGKAIGLVGLTDRDRRKTGGRSCRVVDYDVSQIVGCRHLLPYYFRSCRLAMAMRNYVYFPDHVSSAPVSQAREKKSIQLADIMPRMSSSE